MNGWKLNIVLLVLLAVLAVFIFYVETRPTSDEHVAKLTPLLADEITKIEYQSRNHEAFILEKDSATWWLVWPERRLPANPFHVDKILSLFSLPSESVYELDVLSLEKYGLDQPQVNIRANGYTLVFGDLNPLSYQRYVRQGQQLHLVFDDMASIGLDWLQVVDPVLLPNDLKIQAIDVPGLGRLTQRDGRWGLTGHVVASADALSVLHDAWLHARAMRVSEFSVNDLEEVPQVRVELEHDHVAQLWVISNNDLGLVLGNPELGLAYHFSVHQAQSLMSLPALNEPKVE